MIHQPFFNMKIYTNISLRIIIIFALAIGLSFIPDNFHSFFGDRFCKGNCLSLQTPHEPEWHFGYRHILWILMGLCLFLVQFIRIVSIINKYNE